MQVFGHSSAVQKDLPSQQWCKRQPSSIQQFSSIHLRTWWSSKLMISSSWRTDSPEKLINLRTAVVLTTRSVLCEVLQDIRVTDHPWILQRPLSHISSISDTTDLLQYVGQHTALSHWLSQKRSGFKRGIPQIFQIFEYVNSHSEWFGVKCCCRET